MNESQNSKSDEEYRISQMNNFQKGWVLFGIYLKAMVFAFTGGMAATPALTYEIVTKRKMMTEDEYIEIIAISNSLPGIIGINNSILSGYRIAGPFGSLMAVLGTALPAFFSMLLVAAVFQELPENKYLRGAINGIRAVSVAILFDMGIKILVRNKKNAFGLVMIAFAFLVPLFTPISAFYTILLCGVFGIIYFIAKKQGINSKPKREDP